MATNKADFQAVRALFDRVVALPPDEQAAALDAPGVDRAVAAEVRSLLEHADPDPDAMNTDSNPGAMSLGAIANAAADRLASDAPYEATLAQSTTPTIRITHSGSSSLAGQTQQFTTDRVLLGRRPDCDVVFDPKQDQMVSGHHASITLEHHPGGPVLVLTDLGSRNGTKVNSKPVIAPTTLSPGDRVMLGQQGPELTAQLIVDGIPATMASRVRAVPPPFTNEPPVAPEPPPLAQSGPAGPDSPKQGVGMTTLNRLLDKNTKRERKRVWAVLAVVLMIALGGLIFAITRPSPKDAPITAVPQSVIARVEGSVYLVLRETTTSEGATLSAFGTAWSVAPGLLATNAHVAKGLDELEPGQRLIARSSTVPHHDLLITGARIHPGYDTFSELRSSFLALDPDSGDRLELISPFDVAVLEVEGIDGAEQAPPLTLLADDALGTLAPGQPIALVGYPAENMIGTSLAAPVPTVQLNNLNKLSTIFKARGNADTNRILTYDIASAGGASGSPIIDTQGRVIGLLSAGDVSFVVNTRGSRERVSRGITHGQRVDMLQEVLDGSAQRLTSDRLDQWRRAFKRLYLAGTIKHKAYADMIALASLEPGERLTRIVDEVLAVSPGGTSRLVPFRFERAGAYRVVAFSRGRVVPIELDVAKTDARGKAIRPPAVHSETDNPWLTTRLTISGPLEVQVRLATPEAVDEPIELVLAIYRIDTP